MAKHAQTASEQKCACLPIYGSHLAAKPLKAGPTIEAREIN